MNENEVSAWIRPQVRALSAYHVADAEGLVKLDAMENPYRWPETLVEAWLAEIQDAQLNRYPDPSPDALKSRLREVMNLPEDLEILLGNGSDELIQLIILGLLGPGRTVMAPEPSFVMYRMIAIAAGLEFCGVPLLPDSFALDRDAMLQAIAERSPAVIFLSYPNNPTANLFEPQVVQEIIDAAPGLVVLDEAYTPFAQESWVPRLEPDSNVLVLRTLSKVGLAGLRLGLMAGPARWLGEFDKLRLPYNVNVLSQVSADFALRHYPVLEEQVSAIRRDREDMFGKLQAISGLRVWPSAANFILFRTPAGEAGRVFQGLKTKGVLIKNLSGAHPLLTDCLRVTVGSPEENRAFLDALRSL
ncbi:MAG: histidinol-phosphate transaminase [Gammaproteobacteria bacterium]|nr:MAG: histidinol-phosphate transaminase [Gammaproteobacteria bacterium]